MFALAKNKFQSIYVLLLGLVAATLPLYMKWNTWLIILCTVLCLIQGNFFYGLRKASQNRYVILLWLFFFIHVISALCSNNTHEGWAIVERKSSFLMLPVLFFSYECSVSDIRRICVCFVSGVLLAFMICLSHAFYMYHYLSPDPGLFFYQQLTSLFPVNAVYMSALSVIAIHISFYYSGKYPNYVIIPVIVALILFCFLLDSKMMLACLCVGMIILSFRTVHFKLAWILSITILLITSVVIFGVPRIKQRITDELNSNLDVVSLTHFRYDTPFTGTSLRLVLWKFSIELLNDEKSWFKGVNTGDFQDLMNEKYRKTGMYTGNPDLKDTGYLGYGPHNQYIEILLTTGIVGLVLFLFLLIHYFKQARSKDHYLAFQSILLFSFFFFSESVLSVNKGIVPFVFFTLLFYPLNSDEIERANN